jgi:glycosyltransferase involved in cell wall biosynthesis
MNILIINHYAGTPEIGMEFRPYYLAREWIKLNHKVTIVAADFSHKRLVQPKVDRNLKCEKISGIDYIWFKTVSYKTSGLKRVLNMLLFILRVLFNSTKISAIARPDIVIASSTYPLDIYPAYLIAKKNKAKLVFELHDLWPLSPMVIGHYSKYHPFIWVMQRAENFACKRCSCCVSLLKNAKDYLVQHGLKDEKFYYIPNGFSTDEMYSEDIPLPEEHELLLVELKSKTKIIIGYVGGHGPSNALMSFVSASNHFTCNSEITFVLIGNGPQKKELIKRVSQKNQKNIYFLPQVPKSSIPSLLHQFDILYAGGVKSKLHSFGTSFNKITDYMLAEKPIIFAVDEPNCLIEEIGCGYRIPAENEAELVKAIKICTALSNDERISMGRKGRIYALKELHYSALAKKFIEAVSKS